MTNTDYLSTMTLSQWKLFSQEERLELYMKAQSQVNQFSASLAEQDLKNQAAKLDLDEVKKEYKTAEKDVKKLNFEIEQAEEAVEEETREKAVAELMLRSGQI